MSAEYGPSGPIDIMIVGDYAQMMEAAKTNQYLAKLMPKTSVTDGKKSLAFPLYANVMLTKTRLTYRGSSKSEGKVESNTAMKACGYFKLIDYSVRGLEASRKKNDQQDGSGVLFDIVVIGDEDNGTPVVNHEKMEQGLGGFPKMTTAENHEGDLNVAATLPTATTAEKLSEAAKWDEIPSDPLTREPFGFSKVDSIEEESELLGLYQGLFVHLPNPPSIETVQGWQENNKIAGGIYHSYKSQHGRSRYFYWFKSHQHFVDQTYVKPDSTMNHR